MGILLDLALTAAPEEHRREETSDALPDPRAEARRQRALAMLRAQPEARRVLLSDDADQAYPGHVVLTVGLRTETGMLCTADLLVRRERYDGLAVLELFERHGGTVH